MFKECSPPTNCNMSCHVSCVMCHASGDTFKKKLDKVVELVNGRFVINRAYPDIFLFFFFFFNISITKEKLYFLSNDNKTYNDKKHCTPLTSLQRMLLFTSLLPPDPLIPSFSSLSTGNKLSHIPP